MARLDTPTARRLLDLVVVAATFGLSLVVALVLGAFVLPGAGVSTARPVALPTLDEIQGSAAIVVASGGLEGRFLLDRPTSASFGDAQDGTATAIDLGNSLEGAGFAKLAVTAQGAAEGAVLEADAVDVTFSLSGKTFFTDPGDRTMELLELDYVVTRPSALLTAPPAGVPIPAYAGLVICTDVKELRSDLHVTITALFQYRPDIEFSHP
ncbi:MAG: hypothetical protein ACRDVM_07420 [Acidimicrobiia bacterium]